MTTVNSQLSRPGAYQNRLEGIVSNLEVSIQNASAARSRIEDADIAATTAALTQQQIVQQATLSVLSQANSPAGCVKPTR
ncbi:MAG: flagellin [Vampirovibrionales bacterium]